MHLVKILLTALLVVGSTLSNSWAQHNTEASASWERHESPAIEREAAPGLHQGSPRVRMVSVSSAPHDQIEAMLERNAENPYPTQNGFSRFFDQAIEVDLGGGQLSAPSSAAGQSITVVGDDLVWAGAIRVEGSSAFRIRLDQLQLPTGSRIWVYQPDQPDMVLGPFGHELMDESGLWLPALNGPELVVEVAAPTASLMRGERLGFSVGRVLEIFDLKALKESGRFGGGWNDCDIEATCIGNQNTAWLRDAVAHLQFVVNGNGFICSGGLVVDSSVSGNIPYLLTADHCFNTQSSASSLTAYFDYFRSACVVGTVPSLGSVPQVSGSQLLAARSETDFTFLRLNSTPSGSLIFLGWTATDPAVGDILERLHHPAGSHMRYTQLRIDDPSLFSCGGEYHYGTVIAGGWAGGSSGSPVVNQAGRIVGQMFGSCGGQNATACDFTSLVGMDGKFSRTYPFVAQWINPADYFADLVIDNINVNNPTVDYGQSLFMGALVVNIHYQSSGSQTTLRWFRSSNSTISTSDVQIAASGINSLPFEGAQGSSSDSIPMTVPGTWWVGACVDPTANEGPTDNNCSSGVQVTVRPQDPLIFDDRFEP